MTFQISLAKQQELFRQGKYVVTDVNFGVIDTIISGITSNRPAKKNFTLIINSSGGSPAAVVYFASFLATLDPAVRLEGIAFGECGSAALALLQCCHVRTALSHCGFFIHHIQSNLSSSCQSYDLDKIVAEFEQAKMLEEELVRLQSKRCGMSRDDWMMLADKGEQISRAIFPAKALELKLVDRVIDRYVIF